MDNVETSKFPDGYLSGGTWLAPRALPDPIQIEFVALELFFSSLPRLSLSLSLLSALSLFTLSALSLSPCICVLLRGWLHL